MRQRDKNHEKSAQILSLHRPAVAPPGGGGKGGKLPHHFRLELFFQFVQIRGEYFFRGYPPDPPKLLSVRCSTNETSRENVLFDL